MMKNESAPYNWEKTTKGIGRKLLDKFGFSGRLGAREDGVSSAIEVRVRPGGLGLGFGDFKEAPALPSNKKFEAEWRGVEYEEEEETVKSVVEKMAGSKSWKRTASGKKKSANQNIGMISAEELIKQAKENLNVSKKQVIIDMRGSQTRVMTDLSNISSSTPSHLGVPKFGEEFLYNINLVVDLSEMSLFENVKRLQFNLNRINTIQSDITLLENTSQRDKNRLDKLIRIEKILQRVQDKLEQDIHSITIEAVIQVFETLQNNFTEEFTLFGLVHILPRIASPILKLQLSDWKPLQDPHLIIRMEDSWETLLRSLVRTGEGTIAKELMHESLASICLPVARRALTNEWVVNDAAPAADLLETLRVILSTSDYEQLIDATILPKIQSAVSVWSSTTDPIPIHSWIHPWLPLLKSKLSCVFPEIRRKLSTALHVWDPSDSTALVVLRPWMGVFDQSSMDQLLIRSIIPKLVSHLRELVINPQNQNIIQFTTVMTWVDVLPRIHFLSLIEGEFFPQWMRVLVTWLNSKEPDFEEVTNWYIGWKSLFTSELLEDPHLVSLFNIALQLMSDSLSLEEGAVLSIPQQIIQNSSYYKVIELRNTEAAAMRRIKEIERPQSSRGASVAVSFKEVVEAYAESSGILFLPKEGKIYEGKQIWIFGNKLCYLDQNVVFYNNGRDNWSPIALEDLLAIAKQ
eukprot:gene909-1764_t